MKVDEKILNRISDILSLGESIGSAGYDGNVDTANSFHWASSALNITERVFGAESHYFTSIQENSKDFPLYYCFQVALGVFRAVKEDYENGAIFELRQIVEAEVFDDFLEQSESLLLAGFHQPAAVIAGSVLEDGLRKLCEREEIELPEKPKLDSMNVALAKNGTYKLLTQKRITALADIRNNAAHGKWDQFTKEDVDDLIQWVRNFMERNYV
jgi:hypothetical protein